MGMNLNLWKSMAIWVNERSQVMILWGVVDGSASSQRMVINGHWVGKKGHKSRPSGAVDGSSYIRHRPRASQGKGCGDSLLLKVIWKKRRHQAQIRHD